MVNISMLIISTIWFMLDLSVSSVPRPCLHMLGSSSLTRVFYVCKIGLHPLYVNVELITPDHHVVSRHDKLSQRCILRENTYTLKFSEGSSCLLRTAVVNKMIPYNNFKKVFPLTVHHCEGSLFRSTTWWSGVIDSNVRIQRVLTSLACTDMASEHGGPKGRAWVE